MFLSCFVLDFIVEKYLNTCFPPSRDKIDMAVRLFDALKVETQHFRLSIQEATNSLATAYKVWHMFSTG